MAWQRRQEDPPVMLSGWIEVNTGRAILFHSDNDESEAKEGWWIPTSQITEMHEMEHDPDLGYGLNRYEIYVKAWLVQKNGFS